jgi:monovalent cation:H+ antiporter-2, CPA2 family
MSAFDVPLIGDLAVIMIASAIAIVVFRKLRQPVVLGYLLAGILVGPGSGLLQLNIQIEEIRNFADLGVIFLLLFIGMEFDLRQLRAIGAPAIIIGTFEVGAMLGLGFILGVSLGLGPTNAIYLGALISISSTAVTIKILSDLKLLEDRATRIVIGVLVIEDFAAVIILSSLSGTTGVIDPFQVMGIIILVIAFFFGTIFVGSLLIPRAFHRLERLDSDEVLMISALGLCFGVALLAVLLGFSPAMGAFLAGVLIGESGVLDAIRPRFEPIRDLFAAIFFVSVGMLIVPALFLQQIVLISIVTLVFIAGKIGAAGGITFLLGYGGRDSLAVGTRLARTGEFSFIIANVGARPGGGMNPILYPMIAGVTLITTFIGPTLVKRTPQFYRAVAGGLPGSVDQVGASYTAWVSKARASSKRDPAVRAKFRENGVRIFLTTVFLIVISWLAVTVRPFTDRIGAYLGVDAAVAVGILVGLAIVVASYPTYIMLRLGRELVELTVAAATEGTASGKLSGRTAVSHIVGTVIFIGVMGLLAIGLFPLFIIASAANLPFLIIFLVVAFGLAGYRIFSSARALQERFENVFTDSSGKGPEAEDGSPAVSKLSNLPRYLWAFGETETIAEYVVPESSPLAGWALADLRIRGRTGARIVAVQHGSHLQTAPPPQTRIHEGDLLLLVGTIADLERFEVLLGRSPEMEIQEASPA